KLERVAIGDREGLVRRNRKARSIDGPIVEPAAWPIGVWWRFGTDEQAEAVAVADVELVGVGAARHLGPAVLAGAAGLPALVGLAVADAIGPGRLLHLGHRRPF